MNLEALRILVDLRDQAIQKQRLAFGERIRAIEQGRDTADEDTLALLQRWYERFQALEEELDGEIRSVAGEFPIIEAATQVRGCGLLNVAKVVAHIDIARAETVSQLWRFAGYGLGKYHVSADGRVLAPVVGRQYDRSAGQWRTVRPEPPEGSHVEERPDRPVAGFGLPYNARLKTACYLVASAFLRANSPYRDIYDQARAYYEDHRPDWSRNRQHRAALRKMTKIWLSHLWETWRELEGLPTRRVYVIEHLGHSMEHKREKFGWPAPAQPS